MYKLIGVESKKVYARGRYRSECFKKLLKKYPNPKTARNGVYPEPLLIKKISYRFADPYETLKK